MSAVRPQLAMAAEFNNISQFGEAVQWDLDFRQIEPGQLDARAQLVTGDRCTWLSLRFNRGFHEKGCPPEGLLTFGISFDERGEFDWCEQTARGGELLNFNLGSGYESSSPSGFQGHTFSFDRSRLRELARVAGLSQPLDRLIRHQSVWRSPAISSLGRRMQVISGVMAWKGRLPDGCATLINDEIGLAILGAVASDSHRSGEGTVSHRFRVLSKALEIIEDRDRLPITVADLALEVNTSLSTLRRVFIDKFGLPPKAYIRARCLSAVRDQLALSPPGTHVADVANRWGFWHMGQFAADYQRMFGLLPSQQLSCTD